MNLEIALAAIIFSAGLYGSIAYSKFVRIKTIRELFHIDSSKPIKTNVGSGATSLVAANLTLGTGLIYLSSLAQEQALFALLTPLGVLIGYYLLSHVIGVIHRSDYNQKRNILEVVKDKIGGRCFYYFISLTIVVTYLILVPFEIYVSSNLIASLLPLDNSDRLPEIIAYSFFFIVVVYSMLGGLRGVIATDKVQLSFLAAMIVFILACAWFFAKNDGFDKNLQLMPEGRITDVLLLGIVSIATAIATQIYSILNLSMGTNFSLENQQALYKRSGLWLFTALSLFTLTGLATGVLGTSNFGSIDLLFEELSTSKSTLSTIAIFVILLGMMAVLISTIDSGIMAISQTAYDNLFQRDSHSNRKGKELWVARLIFIFGINSIAAIPLVLIFKNRFDLVGLLLSSIAGLTVSAAFIVSAAINISKYGHSLISNLLVSLLVLTVILSVWGLAIFSAITERPTLGNCAILAGIGLGILFYFIDRAISLKYKATIS